MTAYRFTDEKIDMPKSGKPYLYVVLDGALRLHTPSGIMDYMAGQYSVSRIDTPLYGTIVSFSEKQDFLAVALDMSLDEIVSSALDLDNDITEKIMKEMVPEQEQVLADVSVIRAVYRLFAAMKQPLGSEYIRRNIMREIIYYVLCGSCGKQLLRSVANIRQIDEIYAANSWIKENFRDSFTVGELAEKRNMSVSQFTRDYRKMFGLKPKEDMMKLRSQVERQSRG